jgi:hypothetical protein
MRVDDTGPRSRERGGERSAVNCKYGRAKGIGSLELTEYDVSDPNRVEAILESSGVS